MPLEIRRVPEGPGTLATVERSLLGVRQLVPVSVEGLSEGSRTVAALEGPFARMAAQVRLEPVPLVELHRADAAHMDASTCTRAKNTRRHR